MLAHLCEQRDARVPWFVAELTPLQQDAYVERLFDDDSWTVPPIVEEADVVALLEAHLGGDEVAINILIDTTNECDLFVATVGLLVAAPGKELAACRTSGAAGIGETDLAVGLADRGVGSGAAVRTREGRESAEYVRVGKRRASGRRR